MVKDGKEINAYSDVICRFFSEGLKSCLHSALRKVNVLMADTSMKLHLLESSNQQQQGQLTLLSP